METQDNKKVGSEYPEHGHHGRSGRAIGGLVIVGVGIVMLARQLNMDIPHWVTSWPMFLIVIGIYIGARHSFRHMGWLVPVAIGTVFLLDDIFLDISIGRLAWPIIIICIGLIMMFRPKRNKHKWRRWDKDYTTNIEQSSDDLMDSVTVFGSMKKNVINKDFKGGEATTFFGGMELNLSQADINGKVVLELTQIFGGTKLVIPPHWRIQTEDMVSVFGAVEDKRPIHSGTSLENDKVLVLKGTCFFGGIDIKSY